jgi:DNA-binding transcriptional regulator YdaS (Cro superfamily)
MDFKSWIESERGRAMALARLIDVPPSFVTKMATGEKQIPARHCKTIQAFSEGLVTCQEMRPTDWHEYWPELAPPEAPKPAPKPVNPAMHGLWNNTPAI